MYAEALNEVGYAENITTILSIINEVRKRAGLEAIDATRLNSKQATFDYIVHERFYRVLLRRTSLARPDSLGACRRSNEETLLSQK